MPKKKQIVIGILVIGIFIIIAVLLFTKRSDKNKQPEKLEKQEIIWITESVVKDVQDELELSAPVTSSRCKGTSP